MINDNPCKFCVPPKRTPTCHALCKEYINWRKELNKINSKIREKRHSEQIADEDYHSVRSKRRLKKK